MLKIIVEGGWVMYPLILCSLLIWAISFEKVWFLRKFKSDLNRLYFNARDLLKENKVNEAKGLIHGAHPMLLEPYNVIFDKNIKAKEELYSKFQRKVSMTNEGLKRFLWILGTIGSSAPFIGLFGTVVGIIKSFESIASSGRGGFSVVAEGLSEALIATAAGIFVAVMAVILYNYFQVQVRQLNQDLKNKLEDLLEIEA